MVGLSFAFALRQEWLGLCIFYAMITVSYAEETVDINLGDYNFKEFLFAVYFY